MRPITEDKIVEVNISFAKAVELFQDGSWIHDHAARNNVDDVRTENSAGNMMEFEDVLPINHGMTRIGSAQKADYDVKSGCKQVNDFAFGFITPLQSDNASTWHLDPPPDQTRDFTSAAFGRQGRDVCWPNIRIKPEFETIVPTWGPWGVWRLAYQTIGDCPGQA